MQAVVLCINLQIALLSFLKQLVTIGFRSERISRTPPVKESAMSFISRLLGRPADESPRSRRAASAPPSQQHSRSLPPDSRSHSQLSHAPSQNSQGPAPSHNSMRKELLRVVLRDTLNRNGIPRDWVVADLLMASSRTREPGIHMRLQVRHWDARLMLHSVAFQEKLHQRVVMLDPQAIDWLLSISWLYALPDSSACPAMPHPGTWTAVPAAAQKITDDASDQARVDLALLMAVRDGDARRHGQAFDAASNFAATEPGGLYAIPDQPAAAARP